MKKQAKKSAEKPVVKAKDNWDLKSKLDTLKKDLQDENKAHETARIENRKLIQ